MSQKGNILVVDDERDIRELVSGVLSDEGYECRVAGDSGTARPSPRHFAVSHSEAFITVYWVRLAVAG